MFLRQSWAQFTNLTTPPLSLFSRPGCNLVTNESTVFVLFEGKRWHEHCVPVSVGTRKGGRKGKERERGSGGGEGGGRGGGKGGE